MSLYEYKENKGEGKGFWCWQFGFMMCEMVWEWYEAFKSNICKVWNKGKKTYVVTENTEKKFQAFL